eukprot:122895_1
MTAHSVLLLLIFMTCMTLTESGCEDYEDITSCQNNAPCIWRTGRICFGRKNESTKWYEIHRQRRCEYGDVNITKPIDVKVSISGNDSYNNCSALSAHFVENAPSYFVSYGTFDECSFNAADNINATSIQHVHIFCDSNNVWEPCTEFTHVNASTNISRYHCQCGQLQYTRVDKIIDYGGLSHHGYYRYNGTMDRIDRDYPICTQIFTLHIHL